ncbi:MAG: DEAD/DEAH box helicase, partial [Campylobacterota bacterium]|nr:DEAD/DEAH box helicase [Campylobacterota bacterium]
MNYYTLSIIGSPLGEYSYHSSKTIITGSKVSVEFNKRVKDAVVLVSCEKPSFDTHEILEISDGVYSTKQIELAKFIATYYVCSLGDAFSLMVAFNMHFKDISFKGHSNAEHGNEQSETGSHAPRGNFFESKIALSVKQKKALLFLKEHKVSLLFGDTGSGKTEIYMKYFEELLLENKRSIFLMPEISLTPQMGLRLEEHFGESVVMWHSKLTPKQKKIALEKIHSGEAKIIAGPRSALFLPIKELGLIVVDEEHDDSYKSSSRPRYNARDIAIYMGKLHGVNVVLGSATPSLTSYIKFPHIRLKGGHIASHK